MAAVSRSPGAAIGMTIAGTAPTRRPHAVSADSNHLFAALEHQGGGAMWACD